MVTQAQQVLRDALKLSPMERAELVEKILASFSFPERESIDKRWATEAEERIDAYEKGELGTRPAAEVFARLERGEPE